MGSQRLHVSIRVLTVALVAACTYGSTTHKCKSDGEAFAYSWRLYQYLHITSYAIHNHQMASSASMRTSSQHLNLCLQARRLLLKVHRGCSLLEADVRCERLCTMCLIHPTHPRSPQYTSGCTVLASIEFTGGSNINTNACAADQRLTSAQACCARCLTTPGCFAYSFLTATAPTCPGACYLKRAGTRRTVNTHAVSGLVTTVGPTPSPSPGMLLIFLGVGAVDVVHVVDVSTKGCEIYNYRMWLYNAHCI